MAMDIEMLLQENGHAVMGPACSVGHALRLLTSERPDVALLDFNIQGQTVIPVAERLRDLSVPFLLMSAHSPRHLSEYDALAAVRFVQKPYAEDDLLSALAQAVMPI